MDVFASVRCDALTVYGDRLFWSVGCGGDFEPATSRVESDRLGGGNRLVHYAPASCGADRVACERVAVDGVSIFWLTGDGRVVKVPIGAMGATPVTVARSGLGQILGWPYQVGVATAGGRVFWNEGSTIYAAPTTGGTATRVTSVGDGPLAGHLGATPTGELVCICGGDLVMFNPSTPTVFDVVDSNVGCFAVGAGRIVWASAGPRSSLKSRPLAGGATVTHYVASVAGGTLGQIRSVAIDSAGVYAHEFRNVTGGPVVSAPVAGVGGRDISEFFLADPIVAGNNGSLYVSDMNSAIYRLPCTGIAATPGGIEITGIEVTQAIQTRDGRIPLLASKRTFVRVYLRGHSDAAGPWTGVTGRVFVEGFGLPLTPIGRYSVTAADAGSRRSADDDSLLFELSPEHTGAGTRTLAVSVLPPGGRPTSTPEPQSSTRVTFVGRHDGSAVQIGYYGVRYRMPDTPAAVLAANGVTATIDPSTNTGTWPERTLDDLRRDRDEALAYLPLAVLSLTLWPGDPVASFSYTDSSVPQDRQAYMQGRAWGHSLLDMRRAGDPLERVVVLQPERTDYNGNCSSTTPPSMINLQSGAEPGNTLAHELGHSLSMDHTQYVGAGNGGHDPNYPRESPTRNGNDAIDGAFGSEVGLGARTSPHALPGQDAMGNPALWDIMSYHHLGLPGPTSWTAPYTYCKMLHAATDGEQTFTDLDGYTS
jgi:hypothetical protein